MFQDLLPIILSGIAILLGNLLTYFGVRAGIRARHRELAQEGHIFDYQKKMKKLTTNLVRVSKQVDSTLEEIAIVTTARQNTLKELDAQLKALFKREKEMKDKINTLKDVPLPAIKYFAEITSKGEKRSAARDYILFGLGVITSTLLSIILKLCFEI